MRANFTNDHLKVGVVRTTEEGQALTNLISSERMLYGGSLRWAEKKAGPLTQRCMSVVEELEGFDEEVNHWARRGYHPVIDTKSVLLMPGQYPCIPGWHCDGVIRSERGSQPDLSTLKERVPHYVCVVNDVDDSATEFLSGPLSMDVYDDPEDIEEYGGVWMQVDKQVRGLTGVTTMTTAHSHEMIRINRDTLHRCPPVVQRQWRYFFRMSFYHMPAMNQFRKQVNVYTDISKGW